MKIVKIIAILIVGALSLFAAVHFTRNYVTETAQREKSLAEALLQNQIKQEIQNAEDKAKEELGETLVTTVVTTRPPEPVVLPETEETQETKQVIETTEVTEEPAETEEQPKEEIVTEFTRGGILPTDRTNIPSRTMLGLTSSELNRVADFLIEHYFLDGAVYVGTETRPRLKAKKQLAYDMEKGAIKALNMIYGSIDISDISSVMRVDYDELRREIMILRDQFKKEYRDCRVHGKQFVELYDGCLAYYERLIQAMSRLDTVAKEYNNSTNPILAAALLMSKVEDVIIPEVMAVLESSFDLIEVSHDIFLEGTQGTKLLSRQEVTDIIVNPALILDTGLA